jgi:hypothetical protein
VNKRERKKERKKKEEKVHLTLDLTISLPTIKREKEAAFSSLSFLSHTSQLNLCLDLFYFLDMLWLKLFSSSLVLLLVQDY